MHAGLFSGWYQGTRSADAGLERANGTFHRGLLWPVGFSGFLVGCSGCLVGFSGFLVGCSAFLVGCSAFLVGCSALCLTMGPRGGGPPLHPHSIRSPCTLHCCVGCLVRLLLHCCVGCRLSHVFVIALLCRLHCCIGQIVLTKPSMDLLKSEIPVTI